MRRQDARSSSSTRSASSRARRRTWAGSPASRAPAASPALAASPPLAASPRAAAATRRTAQLRFTAVGRAASSSAAISSSAAVACSALDGRRSSRPSTTAKAAATPIAGAPRIARRRSASTTSATVRSSSTTSRSGSSVWSIASKRPSRQATALRSSSWPVSIAAQSHRWPARPQRESHEDPPPEGGRRHRRCPILAGVSMVPLWLGTSEDQHRAPSPAAIALVLLINLPLAWRRRWPVPIGLVVAAASIGYGVAPYPDLAVPIPLGALVAFYTVLTLRPRRTATLIGAGTCTVGLVSMLLPVTNADATDFAFVALLLGATWALGDSAHTRRAYTAELEARAVRLERERELEAGRAAADERTRIARELHDVIAHHVSMMVVQAEAGPVVLERDPGMAAQAFDSISAIGRQALAEMRRLLGVLRSDDDRSGPSLGPQPGLDQLPALVEQVRRAGLEARLEIQGEPRPLPPGMDLSAYRIVQEALTNAVRHAGPGTARVLIRYGDDDLRLEVRDDGLGGRPGNGAGHGLIGMRERVNLFGGELDAGPRPDGGFAVAARLPLPSG